MVEKLEKEVLFPAPYLAHWVTGPVACCRKHADDIVKLGAFTGAHVAITENPNEKDECSNCIDENK